MRRGAEGEEREAYHWHDCGVCGREWEHGSRRCDGVREKECEDCAWAERRAGWGDEDVPF